MLKTEWKKLIKNRLMLIVIIAVILIPTIYTTLFLGSMWDPYGNVDKLPVAVVNLDLPAQYGDTSLNIGDSLIKELKQNDSLHFCFTDQTTAEAGLKNGDYYMVITIPENFSETAASVTTNSPRKMELLYETNPGTNYIASKMSETAMKELQASVREEVTGTYTRVMFGQINEAGKGLNSAADGAGELHDGINQLSDGSRTITENLQLLSESTLTFRNGAETFAEGLNKYLAGVKKVTDGSQVLYEGTKELQTGISRLNSGTKPLADGINRLADGSSALSDGMKNAQNAAAALTEGTKSLDNGLSELNSGLSLLKDKTAALPASVQLFTDNISNASQGTQKLIDSTGILATGANQLYTTSEMLTNGLLAVTGDNHSSSQALSREAKQLSEVLNTMSPDTVNGNSANILSLFPDVQGTLSSMNTDSAALSSAAAAAKTAAQALSAVDPYSDPAVLQAQIEAAVTALNNAGDALEQGSTSLSRSDQIQSTLGTAKITDTSSSSASVSALQSQASLLAKHVEAYTAGTDQAADGSQALTRQIPALQKGISDINENLSQLNTGMKQMITASDALSSGSLELSQGINDAAYGSLTLQSQGSSGLMQGASGLSSGLKQLTDAGNKLWSGTSALKNTLPELTDGMNTLENGSTTLTDSADLLSSGLKQLTDTNKTLSDGAGKLTAGASQIQDGSGRLYKGSTALSDGITEAGNGAGKLNQALKEGASQISNTNTSEATADMFASPVATKETQITTVPDNGHAMAPYMMSVALWVGCIAFSLIYPLTEYHGKLKSGTAWWLSKSTVLYTVAILQALVMLCALHIFDGFAPAQTGETVLTACIASLTFMSIMYFFTNMLGKVGSFLMLIFMVIQLSGSVGTYPLELSGNFVPALHGWVPFTYTVKAFRSTISGGADIRGCLYYLLILFIIFTILTLVEFKIRTSRINADKKTILNWLERHGLA